MNTNTTILGMVLAAAALVAGCRSNDYRVPPGGVTVSDPSGLQITATRVRAGGRGFSISFDLANEGNVGLLVPFSNLEAEWGGTLAAVTIDPRRFRKMFTCTYLKVPGSIEAGMFADTHWVTGVNGEAPRGEAIYLKPRSRVQRFDVQCTVPLQPGGDLTVRWPHIYSGDAQGAIIDTVATGLTWAMASTKAERGE